MTNAFASTNFETLDSNVNADASDFNSDLLKQRYKHASIHITHDDHDVPSDYTIGSGSLPGDKIASDFFSRAFREPVKKWIQSCAQPYLKTICPLTLAPTDVSKTIYADDLFNIIIVHGLDQKSIERLIDASNNNLTENIQPIGVAQNTSKQEITATIFGEGSRSLERQIRKNKLGNRRLLPNLKYLGVFLADNGKNTKEINARLNAAWTKWYMFSKLITDDEAPFHVRRLCFINMVYNALLSGTEAFVFTDAEYDKLNNFVFSRCRALLLGKAHSKDSNNKHTSISNVQVMKKVGILPVHLELAVRRLKWFKTIVLKPSSAGTLIATWFGNFEFSKQDPSDLPWNVQLYEDLSLANELEGWSDISELALTDPIKFFKDAEVREQFENFDHKYLRASLLHNLKKAYTRKDTMSDVPSGCFPCNISLVNGEPCNFVAHSHSALCRHQVFSKQYGHNRRSIINTLTITNQCCICRSVFSSRISAQHHTSNALIKGICKCDQGFKTFQVKEPHSLVCPLSAFDGCTCDFTAESVPSLQLHVLEHLKQYFDIDNQVIELGDQASTLTKDSCCKNPDPVFPVPVASSSGTELTGPNSAVATCHSPSAQNVGLHGKHDDQTGRRQLRDPSESRGEEAKGGDRRKWERCPRYQHDRCDNAIGSSENCKQLSTENQDDGINHDVDTNAPHGITSECSGLCEKIRIGEQRSEAQQGITTSSNLANCIDRDDNCSKSSRTSGRKRSASSGSHHNCRETCQRTCRLGTQEGLLSHSSSTGTTNKGRKERYLEIRSQSVARKSEADPNGDPVPCRSTRRVSPRGDRSTDRSREEDPRAHRQAQVIAAQNPSESSVHNVLDSRQSKSSFNISSVSHSTQDPKLPQEGGCHEVSISLFGSETRFDKPRLSFSSSDLHTSTEQQEASSTSEDRNYQIRFDNPSQPSSSLSDLHTSHEQYETSSPCEDRNYQDGPVSQDNIISSSFSSSVHNSKPHTVSPIVSPPRIQVGTTGRVPSMLGSSSEFETTNSRLPCSEGTMSVSSNLPNNATPNHEIVLHGVDVCNVFEKTGTDGFFPVPARTCVLTARLLRCKMLILLSILVLICPTTIQLLRCKILKLSPMQVCFLS